MVAFGYNQIPGVNFTENYSPVILNITARILIIIVIIDCLQGKLVDVETSIFYATTSEKKSTWNAQETWTSSRKMRR